MVTMLKNKCTLCKINLFHYSLVISAGVKTDSGHFIDSASFTDIQRYTKRDRGTRNYT
jgi:hypothetical protein